MRKTYKQKIKSLAELIEIQGDNGNWNYDPYMHGMLNGMILSQSVFTDKDPIFKEAPEKWLYDKSIIGRIKNWLLVKTNKLIKSRR